MLGKALTIVTKAGKILEKHWNKPLTIDMKLDGSVVTSADLEVNEFLTKSLQHDYSIPVVSEESIPAWEIRQKYRDFWLIDPLDGTKEFIERFGDFCICLAYIRNGRPINGIIYAPALDEMFVAIKGAGVTMYAKGRKEKITPVHMDKLIIANSRFHPDPLVDEFATMNNITHFFCTGAALKFIRVATGHATIYPRFHGLKEWDVAAGDIIVHEAGGLVFSLLSNKKLIYNTELMQVDPMLVLGHSVKHQNFLCPPLT